MKTNVMNHPIRAVIAGLLFAGAMLAIMALGTGRSQASIIISYAETPGEMQTTVQSTTNLNFDSLKKNSKETNVAWGTVGTIDQVYVSAANQYGGATNNGLVGGTNTYYAVQSTSVGGNKATPTTTITFNTQQAYFGFWWSAGDAANTLKFYSNGTLIADYNTSTLLSKVASDTGYLGNPTNGYLGQNTSEAYAYINVFGLEGSTWDSIVLSNLGTSGFETDNWATRAIAYGGLPGEDPGDLPGKPAVLITNTGTISAIPEPGSALLGAIGILILLRRRR